jgi:hypothetical protein
MPRIMITCPIYGKAIETGLTSEQVILDTLSDVTIPVHCPACLKVHKWRPMDAWIEGLEHLYRPPNVGGIVHGH